MSKQKTGLASLGLAGLRKHTHKRSKIVRTDTLSLSPTPDSTLHVLLRREWVVKAVNLIKRWLKPRRLMPFWFARRPPLIRKSVSTSWSAALLKKPELVCR